MTVDPTRPGVVYQSQDYLEQRVRRLEEVVDELSKKDLTNATVGQGGRFRGVYATGSEAFVFGKDSRDGINKARINYTDGTAAFQIGPGNPNSNPPEQEQMRLNDQQGKRMFATDGIAGYGLAEPSFQHLLCPIYGLAWVAGVEQVAARAFTFLYNAALYTEVQVRNFAGGVTAVTGRVIVTNGDGSQVVSSSTPASGANNNFRRVVLLPADFMNSQNLKVEWAMTTTGSGTMDVWPRVCRGVTKSFYDTDAGDQ